MEANNSANKLKIELSEDACTLLKLELFKVGWELNESKQSLRSQSNTHQKEVEITNDDALFYKSKTTELESQITTLKNDISSIQQIQAKSQMKNQELTDEKQQLQLKNDEVVGY